MPPPPPPPTPCRGIIIGGHEYNPRVGRRRAVLFLSVNTRRALSSHDLKRGYYYLYIYILSNQPKRSRVFGTFCVVPKIKVSPPYGASYETTLSIGVVTCALYVLVFTMILNNYMMPTRRLTRPQMSAAARARV